MATQNIGIESDKMRGALMTAGAVVGAGVALYLAPEAAAVWTCRKVGLVALKCVGGALVGSAVGYVVPDVVEIVTKLLEKFDYVVVDYRGLTFACARTPGPSNMRDWATSCPDHDFGGVVTDFLDRGCSLTPLGPQHRRMTVPRVTFL